MDDKVAVMNLEQLGAYWKLLCLCWNNDGLPNDENDLKDMCGNPKNWENIWKKVGKCFYECNGKLRNKRLDKERKKQEVWREKSKEGGIKSGKTRREKSKSKGGSFKTKGGSTKAEPNPKPPSPSSSSISSSIPSSKDIVERRKQIIDYFNETTNQKRSYNCKEINNFINGRLNEGRTLEDFKHVIDTKATQWKNNPKMRAFLRPSTLFRPGHFEDYLNEPYEDPRKKVLKPGQSYEKKPGLIPMRILSEAYKILDRKTWKSNSEFYDKAKSAFPIIRTQWEQSDGKPGTFIKLVEGV